MNEEQLRHLLRAAAQITGEREFIVIGSQSILASHPDAPRSLRKSVEGDTYPKKKPEKAIEIDGAIGELSPFHQQFGYYAHGVSPETATLPMAGTRGYPGVFGLRIYARTPRTDRNSPRRLGKLICRRSCLTLVYGAVLFPNCPVLGMMSSGRETGKKTPEIRPLSNPTLSILPYFALLDISETATDPYP